MTPQNYKLPLNCIHRTEEQASFQIIQNCSHVTRFPLSQFNGRNVSKYSCSSDVDCGMHGNAGSSRTGTNSRPISARARTSEMLGSSSKHTRLSHGDLHLFLSGQIVKVGPVCCATIAHVSEDCWPKMFPINIIPSIAQNRLCCTFTNLSRSKCNEQGLISRTCTECY
ncbi:hypothetical protein LWI28_027666 [Acer negundo]|uniref:Prolamin-like domain-containing protein n=1 Tax=Acer negundo TaxID=4023 RepID=A0AAD5INE9_ACENE|nr:hypothetical protein LWI28_027666 [Acer negundo]